MNLREATSETLYLLSAQTLVSTATCQPALVAPKLPGRPVPSNLGIATNFAEILGALQIDLASSATS